MLFYAYIQKKRVNLRRFSQVKIPVLEPAWTELFEKNMNN